MEEIEVPTEKLNEMIQEKVEEAENEKNRGWTMYVAISTALTAVLAALSSLLAGHHSDEALISQIKASDQWAYYQAKGIKAEIKALSTTDIDSNKAAIAKYKKDQESIQEEAKKEENESALHLKKHGTLAMSVTMFQVSIALSAIALLTRRKPLWLISLLLMVAGAVFFVGGLI